MVTYNQIPQNELEVVASLVDTMKRLDDKAIAALWSYSRGLATGIELAGGKAESKIKEEK